MFGVYSLTIVLATGPELSDENGVGSGVRLQESARPGRSADDPMLARDEVNERPAAAEPVAVRRLAREEAAVEARLREFAGSPPLSEVQVVTKSRVKS
jgi:hypothetical protein